MVTKRVAVGLSVVVLVLGLIALIAFLFSGNDSGEQRLEEAVSLPLRLTPEDQGASGSRGELTLMDGGVADLRDFPVGRIVQENACTEWGSKKTFTGAGEWVMGDDLLVRIATAEGEVIIGPYHPARGDVVWYRFGVPICNGLDPLWYRGPPER